MIEAVEFTIENLRLPNPLNTERGTTRGARMGHAKRHKEIKRHVALHTLSRIGVRRMNVPKKVVLTRGSPNGHLMDRDGLLASLKYVIDALAEVFNIDDRIFWLCIAPKSEQTKPGVHTLKVRIEW